MLSKAKKLDCSMKLIPFDVLLLDICLVLKLNDKEFNNLGLRKQINSNSI